MGSGCQRLQVRRGGGEASVVGLGRAVWARLWCLGGLGSVFGPVCSQVGFIRVVRF